MPDSTTPTKKYLYDTTVVVGYWRKKSPAAQQWIYDALDGSVEAGVSMITETELWYGAKTPKQQRDHKVLLAKFRKFQFNLAVARRTGELLRFVKESGGGSDIPDLIIAATAEYYHADVVTENVKHFENLPLKNIKIIPMG